ncbi:hypothetical protein B0H15DRAFT_949644 [Mycena belliarum]|uniref:Zn(2)-C6 fungal-type domain-containing protein n=1 Tax=Mycena belliarum TaxID=1033014 RepID=A0AAD6U4Q7_9AGAR|nr:hypothetical protein B0H15DRAFT_949644 [Mycena belliae]
MDPRPHIYIPPAPPYPPLPPRPARTRARMACAICRSRKMKVRPGRPVCREITFVYDSFDQCVPGDRNVSPPGRCARCASRGLPCEYVPVSEEGTSRSDGGSRGRRTPTPEEEEGRGTTVRSSASHGGLSLKSAWDDGGGREFCESSPLTLSDAPLPGPEAQVFLYPPSWPTQAFKIDPPAQDIPPNGIFAPYPHPMEYTGDWPWVAWVAIMQHDSDACSM